MQQTNAEKDSNEEIAEDREILVEYLKAEMIGPLYGENEALPEPPSRRYSSGMLFPKSIDLADTSDQSTVNTVFEEQIPDEAGLEANIGPISVAEEQGDDPITLANENLPACIGISFHIIDDPHISIEVRAGIYQKASPQSDDKDWIRKQLSTDVDGKPIVFGPDGNRFPISKKEMIFDGRAYLYTLWRRSKIGWLVTVNVINARERDEDKELVNTENSLYQVELKIRPMENGTILPSDRSSFLTDDPEEKILDLQYQRMQAFGVGHGCSVDWNRDGNGRVTEIRSEFLPRYEVSPITYDVDEKYLPKDQNGSDGKPFVGILSYYHLYQLEDKPDDLNKELAKLINGYKDWVESLREENDGVSPDLLDAKDELIQRLDCATERMSVGLRMLENNALVRRAFCLADQAMLMQRVHATEKQYAGTKKTANSVLYQEPVLSNYKHLTWRPFQLAFRLLVLSSLVDPTDKDRNVVDLIWFPTGGGKTEAYLAVIAFNIFYRRMKYHDAGAGTASIMRYTLRLLTGQQFERAAALICACELIRRNYPEELGDEEISIGLWVGGAATPNNYETAKREFDDLIARKNIYTPFQIASCPWCGTELVPILADKLGEEEFYGYSVQPNSFMVFCPSDSCPFHNKLPVGVVDEQLYDEAPTLLMGTVDKFARMPWEERTSEFFGGSPRVRMPPDLILQDELHLISGSLGTMVGLYEVAVDALSSWNAHPPKVIASTATIRRADEQCLGLYNRKVRLFPPSGVDAADNFFSRFDKGEEQGKKIRGRLYVGFMSQGQTASTTMIRLSAVLLQAPIELNLSSGQKAYWNVVAYHNNLRELGKTLTFAMDDIPGRIKVIASDPNNVRILDDERVEELTSNRTQGELVALGERLKLPHNDPRAISYLVSSNMISVGVDFPLLGLMLVSGQPKSTSEYIQATSRVGRSFPGLVITMLSPARPRDRSHFERFVQYHSALYRYVEPGSVTPFSPPAMDRALHAVLVTVIRHSLGLNKNKDAAAFRNDLHGIEWMVGYIRKRIEEIDPDEKADAERRIGALLDYWIKRIQKYPNLIYDRKQAPQLKSLLVRFEDSRSYGAWRTLNNMRNVDKSCVLNIKKGRNR